MKINSILVFLLFAPLTVAVCSAAPSNEAASESNVASTEAAINLDPKTVDEAVDSLNAIHALEKLDSARGLAALAKLEPT